MGLLALLGRHKSHNVNYSLEHNAQNNEFGENRKTKIESLHAQILV